MRIVKLLRYEKIISELGKLKSNLKGKIIDMNLAEISKEFDFRERNIAFGELSENSLESFFKWCYETEKIPCVILLSRKLLINILKKAVGGCKDKVMLVGAENLSGEEIKFIAENKIRNFGLNLFLEDISDACDAVMEFAYGKELAFIVDGSIFELDEGGLTCRQGIYILSRMSLMKNLKIACFSGFEFREKIGAKLSAEMI